MHHRPYDINQRARLVVGIATGQIEPDGAEPTGRARSARARAESMSAERRREIAQKAAAARWGKIG